MPLSAGARLGFYEILSAIGAGGMGEVYRARDTKLNRDVAIKVLPALFANDAERLGRFTREAQTLASLNHPNIAAIYGIEESNPSAGAGQAAFRALIMELVEGEDLSVHIARGPMPIADALPIARQIVEALEAAHELGIVHRDLKPANIKVRTDGTVKVLDFGLAKAMDLAGESGADAANSPTLSVHATGRGTILGTAAYMSPEQARGRPVDKRSDVWAFGCVLYEMLTGTRAFDGEDATEIISAVVKSEPDWNAFPAGVPAHVRAVVTRCLVKDRKARIPDLSVVRFMLDGPIAAEAPAGAAPAPQRRSAMIWKAATFLFVLTTLAGGAAWYLGRSATPAVVRFLVSAPDNATFTLVGRPAAMPAISPDGRTLAFTAQDANGKRLLWVRPIDSLAAQPLVGTDGAGPPFWSPDSRSIGYAVPGKLMKIAATGGPPQTLCTLSGPTIITRGGAWNRDGVIVFNNGPAPLYRVSSAGGQATPIGQLSAGESARQFPSFLPDGRHVLYHASGSDEVSGLYVTSLDTGESKRVLESTTGGIYAPQSGHLLFVRQGTLLAQPFDPKTLTLAGEPVPIAERVESAAVNGLVAFSLSDTGVLAYGIGAAAGAGFEMVWVDRQGKVTGTAGPPGQYRGLDLAPDGSRVAAHRHDGEGGDIWLTDLSRGTTSRFTFDATQDNSSPSWSPDGSRIAFSSIRAGKRGVYVRPANNAGDEERLFEADAAVLMEPVPLRWTPDGRSLLFGMYDPKTLKDLWLLPVSGEQKAAPLLRTPFSEHHGQISPDGKWLAYMSNETGVDEIYVQPASPGAGKWSISTGGGVVPRWRGDSRELFYMAGGKMMAVDVTANGSAFEAGTPKALFDHVTVNAAHSDYFPFAVTKDGQRFLISRRTSSAAEESTQAPIVVVLNWMQGLGK